MGNGTENPKTNYYSSIDRVGIKNNDRRTEIEQCTVDDISVWKLRELYSITQISLLMAGISPYKVLNIDSAYVQGYADIQIQTALIVRDAILDGLLLGMLTPYRLIAFENLNGGIYEVDPLKMSNISRSDISLDDTEIQKAVVFNWLEKLKIRSIRHEQYFYKQQKTENRNTPNATKFLDGKYSTPALELLVDHIQENLQNADEEYLTSKEGLQQQKQYLRQNGSNLTNKELEAIHTVARAPQATERYTKNNPATGKNRTK